MVTEKVAQIHFLQEEKAFAERGNLCGTLARHRVAFLRFHEDLAIKTGSQRVFRGEMVSSVRLPSLSLSRLMISNSFSLVLIAVVGCQPVSTGWPPETL